MDRRCAAQAEKVSAVFRRREHKRPSWDPINDRERAKRMRLLRLPEEKVETKPVMAKEH